MATKEEDRIFTLKIKLIDAPVPDNYDEPEVYRIIQIKGSQTLHDLHKAIFKAFKMQDEKDYEFGVGDDPFDSFVVWTPGKIESMSGAPVVDDTTLTRIGEIGLGIGSDMGYMFDSEDDWRFEVKVNFIGKRKPRAKYPKVIERKGKAPPQYPYRDR